MLDLGFKIVRVDAAGKLNFLKLDGLLLLLAIGEENYWVMQGKGLEGVLSSGMLGDYLYEYLEPDFAIGDYDAGVYKVFNAFCKSSSSIELSIEVKTQSLSVPKTSESRSSLPS